MPDIDQNSLIAKFQEGSTKGFVAIHKTFYTNAFRQAFNMVRGEDAAKDILAESFFSLYQKREALSSMPEIAGYLKVTIHNKCLNYIKHQAVISAHQAKILHLYSAHEQAIAQETKRIRDERIQLILDEIEKLPRRCKQVLKLYLKEYNDDQIAETLQISKKSVHNIRYNALQLLKVAFKGHPEAYLLLITLLHNDNIIN